MRPAVRVQPDQGQVGEVAPARRPAPASSTCWVSADSGRPDRPCSSGTTSDISATIADCGLPGSPATNFGRPSGRELGHQHREAGPDRDRVRHVPRAQLGQRGVQVVDRAVHGAAGGADQVGVVERAASTRRRGRPGCPRPDRAGRSPATGGAPSRRSQPGSCGPSESRTRPCPGGPAVSSSSPKMTTAVRTAPAHRDRVVAAGGGEADDGRRDRGAGRKQLLARPPPRRRCRASRAPAAHAAADPALFVESGVLDADDVLGADRNHGAGGDLHRGRPRSIGSGTAPARTCPTIRHGPGPRAA